MERMRVSRVESSRWIASTTGPTTTGMSSSRRSGPVRSTGSGHTGRSRRTRGLRFDPEKLLLDPYGLAVAVPEDYSRAAAQQPGDNTAVAMKSVVVDPSRYDWEGDCPLRRPYSETIIYELHVRGFTKHPSSGVSPDKAGTYAGLIEKIPYLKDLGVTAVELLPVFQFDAQDAPPGRPQLLGLRTGLAVRAARGVQLATWRVRRDGRVSRHGQGVPPRGARGHSRRGVQPHRGGRRRRTHASLPRDSRTGCTTPWRRIAAATRTTRAPATR